MQLAHSASCETRDALKQDMENLVCDLHRGMGFGTMGRAI